MKPAAMRMAGAALWMAVWWICESAPIPVTALLPLAVFPLLGILPAKTAAMEYGNHIVFLFLGGFMIALAMERWNLHRRIALKVIGLIGSTPRRIVLGFMLATAFLSMWISNTATAMMMFPIAVAVVKRICESAPDRDKAEHQLGAALMLGLAYASSIGGMATLIGTPPNIVFAGFVTKLYPNAPSISFLEWFAFGVPFTVIFLPIAWAIILIMTGFFKKGSMQITALGSEVIKKEIDKLGPMTRQEKTVLAVFCTAALLWIFREPIDVSIFKIPGWSQLFPFPGYFEDSTVAMIMGLTLFLLPSGKGERLLNVQDLYLHEWRDFESNAPWGILLLFGGGFALAKGLTESGLSQWIGDSMHFLSGMPTLVMIFGVCLIVTFLTEVTSNTATATMMMPLMGATAIGLGANPILLMLPAALSASCAFMLPVATPPNAIVFGSKWITVPIMARTGFALNIIGAVVLALMVYYLAPGVFGIDLTSLPVWAK